MTWYLKEPRKYPSREEILNGSDNFFFGFQVKLETQAEENGLKLYAYITEGKKRFNTTIYMFVEDTRMGVMEGNRKKKTQGRKQTEILSLPPGGNPTPAYSYVKTVFFTEEEKLLKRTRDNE